jgi:hypothetical protein
MKTKKKTDSVYLPTVIDTNVIRSYAANLTFSSVSSVQAAEYDGRSLVGFHKLQRSGRLLPMLPFEKLVRHSSIMGEYNYTRISDGSSVTVPNHGMADSDFALTKSDVSEYVTSQNYNVLAQDAMASIYETGWDAGTFAAELGSTVRLFTSIVPRFVEFAKRHRTVLRSATQLGLSADSAWLEGRYGWRTLWFDIVDLNKLLFEFDHARQRYYERKGLSQNRVKKQTESMYYADSVQYITTVVTDVVNASYRASVCADIMPPPMRFNLAITGWETVKFSFLVDWLIGIGRWLASMSFSSLASDYVASAGVRITIDRTITTLSSTDTMATHTGSSWISGSSTLEYNRRTPIVVSSLPQFNLNIDSFKILDLVSLLTSAVWRGRSAGRLLNRR